jgi:hypothetical protein
VAASLVRFSLYDYTLASVAFFQAILGLEKSLKLHYGVEEAYLKDLLEKAASDGLIHDGLFQAAPEFTKEFARLVKKTIGKTPTSRAETLVLLLPKLRNQYFHGTYLLAPDYLHLTFSVREIVDALTTCRPLGRRS